MDNADEDFIDIEVTSSSSSSSSSYFCYSLNSTEFEFQMSSTSIEKESTHSPADELFYKGNLLPLHLPPRLQMVQKLLQNSPNTTTTTSTSTPFDSCNNSPTSSCKVSEELFYECSTEASSSSISTTTVLDDPSKNVKQWSNKLKLMKLKDRVVSKAKECLNKYMKKAKKKRYHQVNTDNEKEKMVEENSSHRRSFSLSMKKHPSTKSTSFSSLSSGSSSSSSSTTSSSSELHLLKRSSSASSEITSSIEGAIAYCKQSHEVLGSRKEEDSQVEFCSLSDTRIAACEDQER